MLPYLKETLGLSAEETLWQDAERLPLSLRNGRNYSVLVFENTNALLIRMDTASFHLSAFQKQAKKLREYWDGEVILCFDRLTAPQRKALIEARISFIVPGSQLYLPTHGIALQEKSTSERKRVSRLSVASQCLLLFLLYHGIATPLKKVQLSEHLGVSAMHITRAVQELLSLELVTVQKAGRSEYVIPVCTGMQLYEKARPYLINPVQKRVFVKIQNELLKLPLSGESALAERTMLNMPAVSCRAIDRKNYKQWREFGLKELDPAWYSGADYLELEIWKYDPDLFDYAGAVDVVSLAASFANQSDERIEMAVEDMMEGYPW